MTGPHLTPEREAAELRELVTAALDVIAAACEAAGCLCVWSRCPLHESGTGSLAGAYFVLQRLAAALDAERAAHAQTRTALTRSAEVLIEVAITLRHADYKVAALLADEQSQEAQRVLGLAVAEADKPHDGNER